MYYSEELIQEVAESNDIVDVIGDYMTLKRSGNSYKGKCPFHNEKTASFTVSREKKLYHCFGCGVGGNVITFIMEIEKLSFLDALKVLADRVNLVLPEKFDEAEDRKTHEKKQRLYEIHKEAGNYYFKCLKKNQKGLDYLKNRGISAETIKVFGLGISNDAWDHLYQFLKAKGYSSKEMQDAGLLVITEKDRSYDRFRKRLMFPIINPRNQIIGFGGRSIDKEDKGPKYLNSPETLIFSKSYELFNLNRSKKQLENEQLFVVEGYMDVISLYEKGIKNTVAALGTAFTSYHGKILERYTNEVVLVFDGDNAGIVATEKAINILKKTNLNIKILKLPKNEDPDSFIQKVGILGFNEMATKAMTVVEYALDRLKKSIDLNQTDGRIRYGNQSIEILKNLETSLEIDYYSKLIAKVVGIDSDTIRREVLRSKNNQGPGTEIRLDFIKKEKVKMPKAYLKAQSLALRFCMKESEMLMTLQEDYFTEPLYQKILSLMIDAFKKENQSFDLMSHFQDPHEIQQLVGLMMNEEELTQEDYKDAVEIMERFYKESQLERISEQIKEEMLLGNNVQVAKLTNELIQTKKKIKETRRH